MNLFGNDNCFLFETRVMINNCLNRRKKGIVPITWEKWCKNEKNKKLSWIQKYSNSTFFIGKVKKNICLIVRFQHSSIKSISSKNKRKQLKKRNKKKKKEMKRKFLRKKEIYVEKKIVFRYVEHRAMLNESQGCAETIFNYLSLSLLLCV